MRICKMMAHGIEWTYARNVVYTGKYRGFDITVRRIHALSAETGNPWRLRASRNAGGSLAFSHQFWPTAEAARLKGKRLVDEYCASARA